MSRFALFYNRQDLAEIAGELTRVDLTNAQRQLAQRVWNAGLLTWSAAPEAPPGTRPDGSPYQDGSPEDPTLIVVIDSPQATLAALVALLRELCEPFPSNREYICTLADDMELTAVEPWA